MAHAGSVPTGVSLSVQPYPGLFKLVDRADGEQRPVQVSSHDLPHDLPQAPVNGRPDRRSMGHQLEEGQQHPVAGAQSLPIEVE